MLNDRIKKRIWTLDLTTYVCIIFLMHKKHPNITGLQDMQTLARRTANQNNIFQIDLTLQAFQLHCAQEPPTLIPDCWKNIITLTMHVATSAHC